METPEHVKWTIGINRYGWFERLAGHMSPVDLARAVRAEVARLAGVKPEDLPTTYDPVIDQEVAAIRDNFRRTSMTLEERLQPFHSTVPAGEWMDSGFY